MPTFLVICLIPLVLPAIVIGACPKIISRSIWVARPATSSSLEEHPPPYVIIHHSATSSCHTQETCIRSVRSFQNHHMDVNHWDDIGYNFLVGEDGNVYEGRGWNKTGAHAPDYNSRSIGICFIGTFISKPPDTVALNAAKNLISCGVSNGAISANYKLLGHRQVRQTECPGDSLFKEMKKWPNWTASV